MEQISVMLQGGYAYLLIFQILVVSALFVMLILMVVRRLKSETIATGATAGAQVAAASNEEVERLQKQIEAMTNDMKAVEKVKAENASLGEKVKFLESKLLEYEILQEEIGSLSNLKVENEKLKKELMALTKDIGKTGAQIEQLVQESEPAAMAEAPAAPPAVEATPAAEPVVTEPTAEAVASAAPADGAPEPPNLDGLLAEIDALSSGSTPPPK